MDASLKCLDTHCILYIQSLTISKYFVILNKSDLRAIHLFFNEVESYCISSKMAVQRLICWIELFQRRTSYCELTTTVQPKCSQMWKSKRFISLKCLLKTVNHTLFIQSSGNFTVCYSTYVPHRPDMSAQGLNSPVLLDEFLSDQSNQMYC